MEPIASALILVESSREASTLPSNETRSEVRLGLYVLGAKQSAKAASADGAAGMRRGRPPKDAQAGETVASQVEQMGLGL